MDGVGNSSKVRSLNLSHLTQSGTSLEKKEGVTILPEKPLDSINDIKPDSFTLSWAVYRSGQNYISHSQSAQSTGRFLEICVRDMPKAVQSVAAILPHIEKTVENAIPSLKNKLWDFSINSSGRFVVDNSDHMLTESEHTALVKTLNRAGGNDRFETLKGTMIEVLQAQRGPDLYSTGIGRYDLNQENFGQTIRFRSFMNSANNLKHMEALAGQLTQRAPDKYSQIEIYSISFK